MLQIDSFGTILEKAIIGLMAKGGKNKEDEKDSKVEGSNKRKWSNHFEDRQENLKKRVKYVRIAERILGVCRKAKKMCYNCEQERHISPNCPNPKKCECFNCRLEDHQTKNCPRKRTDGVSGSRERAVVN